MGSLSDSLNSPTPLPDNMPSYPHEHIHLELFVAMDLGSSISTGSNMLQMKVSVLKFVNDFLLILKNRNRYKVIPTIRSLTSVYCSV